MAGVSNQSQQNLVPDQTAPLYLLDLHEIDSDARHHLSAFLLPPWSTIWRTMSPLDSEVRRWSIVVESVLLAAAKGPALRHLERQEAQ